VAKHNDLEFLELCGPTQQTGELQDALKRDVEYGEHGTSRHLKEGAVILCNRICAPHTGGLSGTTTDQSSAAGMEDPFIFWNPSPAVTGVIVYTGDKFPLWRNNIFVGAMGGNNLGSRQLHRIVLSRQGRPQMSGNLTLLHELKQRIRDVRQGPDGLIYLTTDEANGAVLKLEPVPDDDAR
jgi:hypothetical protein